MTHRTKTSPYQLAVIANDFQIPFQDEEALLVFKMFLRRERPDWLILNGDSQDFWELSSYDSTARTGKEFRRGDRTPQRKSSTVTFWRRIRLSFVRQGWSMRSQSRKDDGTSKETMPRSDGNQASLRGIRTRVFKRRAASKLFGGEGRLTKHKIATALADRFAELAPILPPKRKPWESEDYRTSIFDAAALGVAYFDRLARGAPVVPPENLIPS
ncbi:MAG: hypothetical protein DMG24_16885 [Acidobacteria bacterium]|nr:MAG: hypothetical protein DMG24_16885 [Acidobacteriota bacterium]